MKSRRKKSAQIRMAIGLVGIRVALIQLFPRRCAPQPFRAGSPRWFLYVFMYGVVRQETPRPHAPAWGSITPQSRKAAYEPLFCCFANFIIHHYSSGKGYIGLMIPFLTSSNRCSAYFLMHSNFSGGIGPPSGPSLKPIIFQLG